MAIEKVAFIAVVELQINNPRINKKHIEKQLKFYIEEGLIYEFTKDGIVFIEFTDLGMKCKQAGLFKKRSNLSI